jgi:hypothetical protein
VSKRRHPQLAVLKYGIGVPSCCDVAGTKIFFQMRYWNVVVGRLLTLASRLSKVTRSNGAAAIANNSSYVLALLSWVRCLAVDSSAT